MKAKIILRVGALTVGATAAVALFVWLYSRTTDLDAAKHERVLGLTDQIAQLDARWNVDVMKSAADINRDYDPLTTPLTAWPILKTTLEHDLILVLDAPTSKNYIESLATLFDQKTALVSKFKMRNAVLKNSLRFLPTAQAEIGGLTDTATDQTVRDSKNFTELTGRVDATLRALATDNGEQSSRTAQARNALLTLRAATAKSGQLHSTLAMSVTTGTSSALVSSALRFNISPEEGTLAALRLQNDELKNAIPNLPPILREGTENLTKHIDLVIKERPEVTRLLTSIANSQITPTLDKLKTAINDSFVSTAKSQKFYEHLLQGYASALLLGLIFSSTLILRNWMKLAANEATLKARLGDAELQLFQADRHATIGQLSANIAHEINTPLASAQGAMQNLAELFARMKPALAKTTGPATERDIEDFEYCIDDGREGLEHISGVILNLLDFVRGDSQEPEKVNVEKLLTTSLNMLTSQMKGSGIQLVTHYAQTPDIMCNPAAIRQVLVNLCRNAADAMKDGGTLTITTQRLAQEVQIIVADTGHGIPSDVLPRIFEANFTTKKGSGVGLAISKRIVDQHHGTITVYTTVEVGATFTVSLPIAQPVVQRAGQRSAPPPHGDLAHA